MSHKAIVYADSPEAFETAVKALPATVLSHGYFMHSSGKVVGHIRLSSITERQTLIAHPVITLVPAAHSQADCSKHHKALGTKGKSAYDLRQALYVELGLEELNPDY